MIGPGKYDAPCTLVREVTAAAAVLLIVLDGHRGSGFSVQIDTTKANRDLSPGALADLLEDTAKQIRGGNNA